MEETVELALPTLVDVQKIYVAHVLEITQGIEEAAKRLGISDNALRLKIKKWDLNYQSKRRKKKTLADLKPNSRCIGDGKIPTTLVRNHNGNQGHVTYNVSPEERDYYYNLDFLFGVDRKYKNHALTPDPSVD